MVNVRLFLIFLVLQVLTERCVSKGVFLKNVLKGLKPVKFVDGHGSTGEEGDWEDVEIADDAVFSCVKCEGKYCWDGFINFEIRTEISTCNPGEICWKGNTKNGTFRGCATRECLPVNRQFNSTKVRDVAFDDNYCCVENECNSADSILARIGLVSGLLFISTLLHLVY